MAWMITGSVEGPLTIARGVRSAVLFGVDGGSWRRRPWRGKPSEEGILLSGIKAGGNMLSSGGVNLEEGPSLVVSSCQQQLGMYFQPMVP